MWEIAFTVFYCTGMLLLCLLAKAEAIRTALTGLWFTMCICIYSYVHTHRVFYLCFHKHVVVDMYFSCNLFSSSCVKSASDSCSFAYTIHEEKWEHFNKASADHSGVCYPTYPAGSRPRMSHFCPGIPEIASEILDRRDISLAERVFSCYLDWQCFSSTLVKKFSL